MGHAVDERKRFGTARCLIVDDETYALDSYQRLLAPHFMEVHTAADVAGAERALREGLATGAPFHAIVLDLNLGAERGEKVLDIAESLPVRPRVVVISGNEPGSLRVLDVQYRAVYLPKPANLDALLHGFAPRKPQAFEFCEVHGLGGREAEIVALICADLADAEIAEHFSIGVGTVRTYIERAADKLGVRGRRGIQSALLRFKEGRSDSGVFPAVQPPTAAPD